jgi:hypothetical protein
MGPRDVRSIHRDLAASWASADEPLKGYHWDTYAEGAVGVSFDFYKGRLVSLMVSPGTASSHHTLTTDEELEAYWKDCDRWRKAIVAILRERYGDPIRAPSVEDENLASSTSYSERDTKSLVWTWRNKDTGVLVDHRATGLPVLRYVELDSIDEVEEAVQAHRRAEEEERKGRF